MATGSVSASPKNRNRPTAPTAPNVRAYASSLREDLAMKVCIGVFATIILTMALASMSFSQTAPAQPQDPTAQSPASPAPASPTSPSAKRLLGSSSLCASYPSPCFLPLPLERLTEPGLTTGNSPVHRLLGGLKDRTSPRAN